MNGWNPTAYEKQSGALRMRIVRDAGTGKWSVKVDHERVSVGGSIPLDTPGEAMDWADDFAALGAR